MKPEQIAYDRPSPKLRGFLAKHYGLSDYRHQVCFLHDLFFLFFCFFFVFFIYFLFFVFCFLVWFVFAFFFFLVFFFFVLFPLPSIIRKHLLNFYFPFNPFQSNNFLVFEQFFNGISPASRSSSSSSMGSRKFSLS